MDVTPIIPQGRQVIQSFRPGQFAVSGTAFDGPILVTPEQTIPWTDAAAGPLTTESFAPLQPHLEVCEVLLIGMGPRFAMLDPAIRQCLKNWGVVADAMSTDAACRTYNVLLAEDRKVAAALLPV